MFPFPALSESKQSFAFSFFGCSDPRFFEPPSRIPISFCSVEFNPGSHENPRNFFLLTRSSEGWGPLQITFTHLGGIRDCVSRLFSPPPKIGSRFQVGLTIVVVPLRGTFAGLRVRRRSGLQCSSNTHALSQNLTRRSDTLLIVVKLKNDPMIRPLVGLIVPVWNDDNLVAKLVDCVSINTTTAEWVVAAVGATEELRKLENRGGINLITCDTPSRGAELNAGARKARGSLLCFHHADSELRDEHLEALVKIARNRMIVGGAFHRRFDNRQLWMIS